MNCSCTRDALGDPSPTPGEVYGREARAYVTCPACDGTGRTPEPAPVAQGAMYAGLYDSDDLPTLGLDIL